MKNLICAGAFMLLLVACGSSKYRAAQKLYKRQLKNYSKQIKHQAKNIDNVDYSFTPTTNFNLRKPNAVVIHHTAQKSCDQTLQTFTLQRTQVSAHYVICRDGKVIQMLNDYLRAWHGGTGKWGNNNDINSSSIGIELDNDGYEEFKPMQIKSLLILLDTLKSRYKIPTANFIGHADIAPTRKNDPNITFPWQSLAEKGYGLWYTDTSNITLPAAFDHITALRIIGYDVKDTTAVIKVFKRKYIKENSAVLTEMDKKILFNLYRQNL